MVWMSTEGKFYLVRDDIRGETIISPKYDTFAGMIDWLEATGWVKEPNSIQCTYSNDEYTVVCERNKTNR